MIEADLEERMNTGKVRRIVTGSKNGKSVILDDSEISSEDLLGAKVFEIWETTGAPVLPFDQKNYKKPLRFKMPEPGNTRLRLTVIPPETQKDAGSGMHKTKTVDYDILLSGELHMMLDDGIELQLSPGDCIIQNGARHAWRNKGYKECILLTVCIGARKTED
jgi:mannose-6-phosphate isomerase-like protein (cupin superfamily)